MCIIVVCNIILYGVDIHQEVTELPISVKVSLDKDDVEEVCILRVKVTLAVFVFIVVARNTHTFAALKRCQLDVRQSVCLYIAVANFGSLISDEPLGSKITVMFGVEE